MKVWLLLLHTAWRMQDARVSFWGKFFSDKFMIRQLNITWITWLVGHVLTSMINLNESKWDQCFYFDSFMVWESIGHGCHGSLLGHRLGSILFSSTRKPHRRQLFTSPDGMLAGAHKAIGQSHLDGSLLGACFGIVFYFWNTSIQQISPPKEPHRSSGLSLKLRVLTLKNSSNVLDAEDPCGCSCF